MDGVGYYRLVSRALMTRPHGVYFTYVKLQALAWPDMTTTVLSHNMYKCYYTGVPAAT